MAPVRTINAPVVLTFNNTYLQQVEIEIIIGGSGSTENQKGSVNVVVNNFELRMCEWKIDFELNAVNDAEGSGNSAELVLTCELLNDLLNTELKVMLVCHLFAVVNSQRTATGVRSFGSDVFKQNDKMMIVLRKGVVSGMQYSAMLYMAIEHTGENLVSKTGVMKKFMEKSSKDFGQAIKDLLASTSFANAKIICTDGTKININKEILACRSPVFEAMFRNKMTEAINGVVKVEDICGKSMKVLVDFLSTGRLDESWNEADVVRHLAIAADKYQVESLREFLDDYLGEEKLIPSDLGLLNLAANFRYRKAEGRIAANVARRARGAETRDQLMALIGMKRKPLNILKKKRAEKDLIKWMNNKLGGKVATESSLELMDYAAEEGLEAVERSLVADIARKLELARTRDDVFNVLAN